MKIAIFGATRGVGQQVMAQALARGDEVVALARTPEKLPAEQAGLTVVAGNVLQPADVAQVVDGADVVVVSLGNTPDNPQDVVSRGTAHIVQAMQTAGVSRLVVVTSLGVGDSKDQVPLPFRIIMKTALRNVIADKERQEAVVAESDLDWTIVRPGGLTDGPATGDYRAGMDKSIGAGQVARADVAAFILDVVDNHRFRRQAPAIS